MIKGAIKDGKKTYFSRSIHIIFQQQMEQTDVFLQKYKDATFGLDIFVFFTLFWIDIEVP